jgi:hypothetical protein
MRWASCFAVVVFASCFGCAAAAEPFVAARGPGGKPDLNGVWRAFARANDGLEAHAARPAYALQEGPHGPLPAKEVLRFGAVGAVPASPGVVVGGTIPYRKEARAKQQENQRAWLERDPEIKCYQPGIPRATYLPFPFQILHNEEALFFAYEYAGAVRNILLEDPGPAPLDSWMGQSVGRWDGDTLVIETTGQNDQTWLDRAGNHHSEKLRVVERFTPTSPHTMAYEATLEDEAVYTRPWQIRMTLYRLLGDDAVLQRFNCVEFVEELIFGHLRKQPLDRELPE